jgi:hypothetical protein
VVASGVAVSINAPAQAVQGSSFTVSVDISDVNAFDAGQFDVSFDESFVRLDNVTAGQIGATQIPVDLWNKMSTGTYRIIVNVPGVPGVSGSGSLAVLHFHAASSAVSNSALSLSNGFLNDNLGTQISATWAGGSINASPPSAAVERPVFRWWVLSVIVGAAVVLIAVTIAGILLRRRQMVRDLEASNGARQRGATGVK